MLRMRVVTVKRQKGVGAKSGRPYDFQTVGGLVETAQGSEYAEIMLDGDAPTPESGKLYELELSFFPDREKRLSMRVEGLRVPGATARAA